MTQLGTLEWGLRSQGRLTGSDRLRLVAQGLQAQLAESGRNLARSLGLLVETMKAQARRSPDTRIGFLCSRLQFIGRIRRAPFPE